MEDVGYTQAGWCTGEGGYEGLKAYVVFDIGRATATGVPTYGFITSGEGPPTPDVPPAG